MERFTTLIGTLALVLALAACSGSASPVPTPVPATATPVAATPAPVTAAPTTTPTPTAQPIDVTVTFDGTNCTYAGPAVVPDGTRILFSLTLKKYQIETGNRLPVVLVGPVVTGTTWDKAKAVGNFQSSQPDWLISFQEMLSTGSWDQAGTLLVQLSGHDYYVACADYFHMYPAILLKVLPG